MVTAVTVDSARKFRWRRFAAAYSLTITADRFVDVAVPVASMAATGDISLAGVYLAATGLPRFVLGPLFSAVLKTRPHLSWCSIGNGLQMIGLSILAVNMALGSGSTGFALAGFITGIGAGIYGLAAQATIRSLVLREHFPRASSTLEVIDSALTLATPLAAGALAETLGPAFLVAATALAFAGAALLRAGLHPEGADPPVTRTRQLATPNAARIRHMLNELRSPFLGHGRRFISVASLVLAGGSLLLIPVASLAIYGAGGSAIDVGLSISAAGLGGLVTGFLAGRFTKITNSITWVVVALTLVLLSVPVLLYVHDIFAVIVLVGLSDAFASWLFVSLPSLRMACEDTGSLVSITAGMMTAQAVASFALGLGISIFQTRESLWIFTAAVCALGALLVIATATGSARNEIRRHL